MPKTKLIDGRKKWFVDKKEAGQAKKERGVPRYQVDFLDTKGKKKETKFFVGVCLPEAVTMRSRDARAYIRNA